MITDHFKSRGYQILAQRPECPSFWVGIDGIAQFLYKGYQISMSTMGRSQGASMTPVCVFKPGIDKEYTEKAIDGFHTVENAIAWIDQQTDVESIYSTILDLHRNTTSTYAQAFRKFILDLNLTTEDFDKKIRNYIKQQDSDVDKNILIQSLANVDMTLEDFKLAMTIFNN